MVDLAPPLAVIPRRRAVPGGRAVVGALLVAVAAVGTFAAASGATSDPRKPYVVARGDLVVGQRLSRGDLAFARMDLPGYSRAFEDMAELEGALVVGPVGRGELVQRSAVRLGPAAGGSGSGSAAASHRQVSVAIDPARAVAGSLQAGEFVDVLATYGGSSDGQTVVVARGVRVVSARDRGGLAGGESLVVVLDVPSADAALALAHAVHAGEVTVVRAGPRADGERAPSPYRTPSR